MTVRDDVIANVKHYVGRIPCMHATMDAVDYLAAHHIPGDLVECGVYRGGHMLLAKSYARAAEIPERRVWLFDTFAGMPPPHETLDVKYNGRKATDLRKDKSRGDNWLRCSLDNVRLRFAERGLLDARVTFVEGKVEDTLRSGHELPDQIAMLRLDTDFYSSTKVELEVLYPRLVKGGILVLDDYGWWKGAKKAADDYFGPIAWTVIDKAARSLVRP